MEAQLARALFPDGEDGELMYRTALGKRTPSELVGLRAAFGEGESGTRAFHLIACGAICVAQDESGNKCGKEATLTVDFDVYGTEERYPVCSETHERIVRQRVAQDLGKDTNDPTFGINGRGRA